MVGQFGSPIAGFTRGYQGTVEDGNVSLTNDPYDRDSTSCSNVRSGRNRRSGSDGKGVKP